MCKLCLQVTEWRLKCEAIEKRESERREVDAKKHREEVTFLENHGEPAAPKACSHALVGKLQW